MDSPEIKSTPSNPSQDNGFFQHLISANSGKLNLAIITVVAILFSVLVSNKSNIKYEYELGKTWINSDLIAAFDYSIQKSKSEIESQENALMANFLPVYEVNENYPEQIKKAWNDTLTDIRYFFPDSLEYADSVYRICNLVLAQVYAKGYLENLRNESVFQVIKDDTLITTGIGQYYTRSDISDLLQSSFPIFSGWNRKAFLELFQNFLKPNVEFSETLNDQFRNYEISKIPVTKGKVEKGDVIVAQGESISPEVFARISSYEEAYNRRYVTSNNGWKIYLGYFTISFIILLLLLFYLFQFDRKVFMSGKKLIFTLIWPLLYTIILIILEQSSPISAYIIPFAIVPILIAHFFEVNLALVGHTITVLLASICSVLGFEFLLLNMIAGMVAAFTIGKYHYFNNFVRTICYIGLVYIVGFFALNLIKQGLFGYSDLETFIWLIINTLLILLAYPLLPVLSRLFDFSSSTILIELTDLNRPLLKNLSLNAPGTLQHSLQVANMAEAATDAIGGDSILVKAAAYYHDIGKMDQPQYFIENQAGINPHQFISPLESAKIIIDHVTKGREMAKKQGIPSEIIEFIMTHHGTTQVAYFLSKQKELDAEGNWTLEDFTYPGPKPQTKEQGVVMLADSLEASAKALKEYTRESIDELVEKIVDQKIKSGQFTECPLTLQELATCKEVFKKVIKSIYHSRVEYPTEST